nr:RES family NAD+ phosphorylase [Pseudomonas sp. ERMR1:02]
MNPFRHCWLLLRDSALHHVNPAGSRFSDGRFGVLYLADSMETALAECSIIKRCTGRTCAISTMSALFSAGCLALSWTRR